MKTDNELIAEFMGVEVERYKLINIEVLAVVPEDGIIDWPELNIYDPATSWNQLIPACQKWDDIFSGKPFPDGYIEMCDLLDTEVTTYKIKCAYDALIKCIKWYNSQTKPTRRILRRQATTRKRCN